MVSEMKIRGKGLSALELSKCEKIIILAVFS